MPLIGHVALLGTAISSQLLAIIPERSKGYVSALIEN